VTARREYVGESAAANPQQHVLAPRALGGCRPRPCPYTRQNGQAKLDLAGYIKKPIVFDMVFDPCGLLLSSPCYPVWKV